LRVRRFTWIFVILNIVERKSTMKPSAYIAFSIAERAKVVAANPGIAFTDVARKLGEKWRSMTAVQKAKYTPKE
jgi:hypothetical protein